MFSDLFSVNHVLCNFLGYKLSLIEAIGTISGIICTWYITQEKIINFYFGIINVILFAIIFYQIALYANALLQLYFLIMNLYGLYVWKKTKINNLVIHHLSKRAFILTTVFALTAILFIAKHIDNIFYILSLATIKIFQINTVISVKPDPYPILDTTILILSVIAMLQMARKIIENWLLWIIINLISVYLYTKQGIYFIAFEYVILLFIGIKGYISWQH